MVILGNILYALISGALAIGFMWLGYKALDFLTPYDTGKELTADEGQPSGNMAVGLVVAGMFIGIGIAIGLVLATSIM